MNRKDFIKLLGMLPTAYHLQATKLISDIDSSSQPNIIILVLDSWSAKNISLYGYPRQTTPLLDKLADKAIVYHNHYAAGHWTFPGTTSLLTGMHQWKHRNINRSFSNTKSILEQRNLFALFEGHNRISYTHNQIAEANILLKMQSVIDSYKPRQELYVNQDYWLATYFEQDFDIASTAWERVASKLDDGYANSLFLSRIYEIFQSNQQEEIFREYPKGFPYVSDKNYYRLETAIDWIAEQSNIQTQPYMAYYHLLPPHFPYNTRREFSGRFNKDEYQPIDKPDHFFADGTTYEQLFNKRNKYDQYILLVDSEINRLYTSLVENNVLDNTWFIITSDHGEMFERGLLGHSRPSFYDPLVHVPLLIFPPGQQERIDIHTPTSAVDLIPTLLQVCNQSIPNWLEGELLPPFNLNPNPNRPIFSMEGIFKGQDTPFTSAGLMLRQGDYKLTYLYGIEDDFEPLQGQEYFELYDLANDPEEMDNLYEKQPDLGQSMRNILLENMKKNQVVKG